ncbi:MAG: electron transfer flavoprotein beta subunit/FixA family protein [Ignavibacteria bacterium]|nr:electron transfer flavoprotein beta subunit/FixA family protein [Bacteroidota bacterium]MSQ46348.1 electron transfer flavoprotein beta subunit/FixA family protein [Ignavibacteria bacterium]
MKILVCVNHVPDTTTKVNVASDNISLDVNGVNFMLNPYDDFAIEEALKTKEKFGGEVVVVSLGGDSHKETLRKSLAMGCDRAVLLKDSSSRDSFSIAFAISEFAKSYSPEIIFIGKQSIDYDNSQMCGLIATFLGWQSVSVVVKFAIEGNSVIAEREIEGGHEIVSAKLPVVIAAQKGLNEPRYPSLKGIMESKRKLIEEINPEQCANKINVLRMRKPTAKQKGKIIGTDISAVPELIKLLHEEAKVI